jgi:Flp pilus assembly pilin Flp
VSKLVLRFLKDNSVATTIETTIRYGLMAVGIAIMIFAAVQLTGTASQPTFPGLPILQ